MKRKKVAKMQGNVKWFDVRKGFGIISDENGYDYFIHFSQIAGDGFKKLRKGQTVRFEAGEDDQGRSVACSVEPTEGDGVEAGDMEEDSETEAAE